MIPLENARAARKTGSWPPQYILRTAGAGAPTALLDKEKEAVATGTMCPVALPQIPGWLQAVQVLCTKSRGPGPHFVLRESEPRVRIVVANAVQRRLGFVIGHPQQEGSTVARHQRSRSNQQSFLLQALAISAVRVNVLQHFFQRFAITNDGERVHTASSAPSRAISAFREAQSCCIPVEAPGFSPVNVFASN